MANAIIERKDDNCKHVWIKRNKYNISVLEKVCTSCGQLELVSENTELTEKELKIIAKVK